MFLALRPRGSWADPATPRLTGFLGFAGFLTGVREPSGAARWLSRAQLRRRVGAASRSLPGFKAFKMLKH